MFKLDSHNDNREYEVVVTLKRTEEKLPQEVVKVLLPILKSIENGRIDIPFNKDLEDALELKEAVEENDIPAIDAIVMGMTRAEASLNDSKSDILPNDPETDAVDPIGRDDYARG